MICDNDSNDCDSGPSDSSNQSNSNDVIEERKVSYDKALQHRKKTKSSLETAKWAANAGDENEDNEKSYEVLVPKLKN
jgi:hypothetical protein|tara:strand:+ start:649 stop:882 length:234 start_codon:yes stop_codon:yes gene_type:complete